MSRQAGLRSRTQSRRAAGLMLLLGLAGCVSVGNEAALQIHHRLHDAGSLPQRLPQPLVEALLIQTLAGDALADSHSIAYARAPQQFAFYQQSQWLERPSRLLSTLAQRRLEARGVARAVARLGEPLRADWLLTLSLEGLHHDFARPPGQGRLLLRAELLDRRSRARLAQQHFELAAAAPSGDAAGAAQALSIALGRSFDALLPWLEAELGRALAARPAPDSSDKLRPASPNPSKVQTP